MTLMPRLSNARTIPRHTEVNPELSAVGEIKGLRQHAPIHRELCGGKTVSTIAQDGDFISEL